MTPQQEVDIVTEQEIAEAVRRALDTLGLTMDDLKKQAQTGRFQSESATNLVRYQRYCRLI